MPVNSRSEGRVKQKQVAAVPLRDFILCLPFTLAHFGQCEGLHIFLLVFMSVHMALATVHPAKEKSM